MPTVAPPRGSPRRSAAVARSLRRRAPRASPWLRSSARRSRRSPAAGPSRSGSPRSASSTSGSPPRPTPPPAPSGTTRATRRSWRGSPRPRAPSSGRTPCSSSTRPRRAACAPAPGRGASTTRSTRSPSGASSGSGARWSGCGPEASGAGARSTPASVMTKPRIVRVNGPVVEVEGFGGVAMLELVELGEARLPGEVIAIEGERATVQVYEYTGGLAPGEPAAATGAPLAAELGPGLLGGVFDGMLRRLAGAGDWIAPGARLETLPAERRFPFEPAPVPERARPGTVLGTVAETAAVEHRVLVPPAVAGPLEWLAPAGAYTVAEPIARIAGAEVRLAHRWPVRRPRPVAARLRAGTPLTTGQRALDLFFPIARGSTAAVPGGFGTGKTVLLQQVAKWCDADVIVYVLRELPALEDPRTGRPLSERTVLVANTSNMPVLAREASIHTGVTVAEFFRDMGHDVVLIADSTSRWAEALREVASRTGELPAEEGYPAGLASQLASFYERSGAVRTLAGDEASVTVLGAVSPPGGDLTEPVSAHTRRFTRCTWSLDRDLAYARP